MSRAPSVLLLTDVVDSTALGEQLGLDAAGRLWAAHDHAARDLLRQWRGREIDKSDGFLLLFGTVADAVGYAQAYHRLLGELQPPLRARVGIHCGPVLLRDNPPQDVALGAKPVEVEGSAKPLAARVMALALGGQTLLSADAQAALGTPAPPLRLQSHGHWRLKGLQAPVELFEVGDEHAPFTPPPDAAKAWRVLPQGELWLPRRELRHSLPAERDSFVGRVPALHELAQRFEAGARLVSLLGIGGAGKTRLAQRFGWTWLGDFPGGAWFCDLSQATSLDGVVHATAQGLELPLGPADPVQQIGQAIAGRGECLVILDNFEQVARHAEATLGRWLDRAPEARFLVTSREVLGIVGEQVLALPPLPPADSVALFMQRAQAATQDFAPSTQEQQAIEPLVQLLDGLPLAVELCAARVRVMPPSALLQRMSERFKLLTSSGGRRDRQATLRATLDWSWDLLSEPERSALAQLSVFEGGFTLEAAEAVIDLSAFSDPPWVVDVVQALVQKSLVRKVSDRRFDLLRTVQDFVQEGVDNRGGVVEAVARHWTYFAANVSAPSDDPWAEIENLAAACQRAVIHGSAAGAVGNLLRVSPLLRRRGPFSALGRLTKSVLAMHGLTSELRLVVCRIDANVCFLTGRIDDALAQVEVGLSLVGASTPEVERAELLRQKGEIQQARGALDDAECCLTACLDACQSATDLAVRLHALNALAALAADRSQHMIAENRYRDALGLARELNDRHWIGGLHGNLGALFHEQGRLSEAEAEYLQAIDLAGQEGDLAWGANSRCNLGLLLLDEGRPGEARTHLEAALSAARGLGHQALEFTAMCNLGIACEVQGDAAQALAYHELAASMAMEAGNTRAAYRFLVYRFRLLVRQGRRNDARQVLLVCESLQMDRPDPLALGLLLCAKGELALVNKDLGAGVGCLDCADSLCRAHEFEVDSELGREIAALRRRIETARLDARRP